VSHSSASYLICCVSHALIRCIKFWKRLTSALECMNIILLYSNHRHVSATHVVVHCAAYIVAHEPGPQLTTRTFYVHHPQHYNPCTTTCCYLLIFYTYPKDNLFTVNLTKIIWYFFCGLIPTHNCGSILVLPTLKMATWVTETCRCLLYNKLTFIHSSSFVSLFKNFT
jgi:hypothetical protein